MKGNINYCLILLFCFISLSCSKESDEVVPDATLSSQTVDNSKYYYCKPPAEGVCAYSQGRYFNRGGRGPGSGWQEVWIGEARIIEGAWTVAGRKTDAERALLQAATLLLSAREQGINRCAYLNALPSDVRNAFNCIEALNVVIIPDGECSESNYRQYADIISQWIDDNHCED